MTLEQEARFIAGRSCAEQADYLREVAASRGAEVADALRRMAAKLRAESHKNHTSFLQTTATC